MIKHLVLWGPGVRWEWQHARLLSENELKEVLALIQLLGIVFWAPYYAELVAVMGEEADGPVAIASERAQPCLVSRRVEPVLKDGVRPMA